MKRKLKVLLYIVSIILGVVLILATMWMIFLHIIGTAIGQGETTGNDLTENEIIEFYETNKNTFEKINRELEHECIDGKRIIISNGEYDETSPTLISGYDAYSKKINELGILFFRCYDGNYTYMVRQFNSISLATDTSIEYVKALPDLCIKDTKNNKLYNCKGSRVLE